METGDWVANRGVARAGARAERKSAAVLDPLAAQRGYAVLHDLRIPLAGIRANIDHVVVTGRDVIVVDSKAWTAGFMWTVGSRSFRGLSRFTPAESRTVPMAQRALEAYLGRPLGATPIIMVWWGRGTPRTLLLSVPGARVVAAADVPSAIRDRGPADPQTVAALSALVRR